MTRVPQGTILEIDGTVVRVGIFSDLISCYRVSWLGGKTMSGIVAGQHLIEDTYGSTHSDRLADLKKEYS